MSQCRFSIAALLMCILVSSAFADDALDAWIAQQDYDPDMAMVKVAWHGPGYHSLIPPGTIVHPTRNSMLYAQALVHRGRPDDLARAEKVIAAVLAQQDTDPSRKTYGIWSWLAEEPLDKMAPPDWNWADFLGASLAEMLSTQTDRLPDELQRKMRAALGHAAAAIRQRDVQPGYTNIAIMGGVVTAVAGELLGDRSMLDYGRSRLERCVQHANFHGNFTEYNSPTYTVVALLESERGVRLIHDEKARAAAEALRQIAWRTIAESFHPATAQWAGPHSRAYSDRTRDTTLQTLADRIGFKLLDEPAVVYPDPVLPCPPMWIQRFKALPSDPLELRRSFTRDAKGNVRIEGTTWLTADATLGSVNHSETWVQRHPIIGYWVIAGAEPAVFKVNLIKDGREFSSGHLSTVQQGPTLLTALSLDRRGGDWHIHLDKPQDGIFELTDLRWRFSVQGRGATAKRLSENTFELAAGDRRVVIHAADGSFAGQPVTWQAGVEGDTARIDAVCYHGEKRPFNFREIPGAKLAAAVELIRRDQSAREESVTIKPLGNNNIQATWDQLTLKAPMSVR